MIDLVDQPVDAVPEADAGPADEGAPAAVAAAAPAPTIGRMQRQLNRLRRLLPVVVGLVACCGLAGAGFAVVSSAQPDRIELDLGTPPVFYALPEITTMLTSPGVRPRYVHVALSFEVEAADVARLQAHEPLLLDVVQDHLRGLTPADLAGELGAETLRTALRRITEAKVAPVRLRSVLFTQLLVS